MLESSDRNVRRGDEQMRLVIGTDFPADILKIPQKEFGHLVNVDNDESLFRDADNARSRRGPQSLD